MVIFSNRQRLYRSCFIFFLWNEVFIPLAVDFSLSPCVSKLYILDRKPTNSRTGSPFHSSLNFLITLQFTAE